MTFKTIDDETNHVLLASGPKPPGCCAVGACRLDRMVALEDNSVLEALSAGYGQCHVRYSFGK